MRNYSKNIRFSLSSLLESRNCLLHCGQFLVDNECKRKFNKLRLCALSIPYYVNKKGRCHGARHGKTEEQKEYYIVWNAWKRCCKKVDSQKWTFHRYSRSICQRSSSRESQLAIGWTEQNCKEMEELAKEDHTHRLPSRGKEKIPRTMVSHLEQIRQKWPMKLRSDFRAAASAKNRLHRKSGEQVEEPISPEQCSIWHPPAVLMKNR